MEIHDHPSPLQRAFFAFTLVGIAVVAVSVPITSTTSTGLSDKTYLSQEIEPVVSSVTRAGFPWSCYTSSTCSGVVAADYSIGAGLANLAVLAFATAFVAFWLKSRYGTLMQTDDDRAAKVSNHRSPAGRIVGRVSGIALVASGITMIFGSWAGSVAWRYHSEKKLIAAISEHGHVMRMVVMPENLSRRIPKQLRWPWSSAQNVELRGFNDEDLDKLSQLSGIGILNLSSGKIDDESAKKIARLKSLRMLILTHVDVRGLSAESIAQWSPLTNLRVNGCEISEDFADASLRLPNLRELDVVDSAKMVASISRKLTGTRLETVNLIVRTSRAFELTKRGEEEMLDIAIIDSPSLKDLSIFAPRAFRLRVSLANLPHLGILRLSNSSVVNLSAENLPRWHMIEAVGSSHSLDEDYDTVISPLFDHLKLVDCSSLSALRLHSRYIQSLEVCGVPNLTLVSVDRWETEPGVRPAINRHEVSDATRYTGLLREISQIGSLRQLDLLRLLLQDVDMSPLAQLNRLTTLDLTGCTLASDQVMALQAIKNLDSLTLVQTGTKQVVVDALLCGSNRWRKLQINASTFDELRLIDQPQLAEFFSQTYFQANHVALIDVPQLEGELRLTRQIESLRIENAPKLRGVSVTGDLPATTRISGVMDLKVFEAGGLGVNDEVLASVCECNDLRRLILRSSNVSRAGIALVAKLTGLDSLHLPGMPVDDGHVNTWTPMTFLRDIVLDRTEIGAASIEQFSRLENLQRLSINHTRLTPEDLRPLAAAGTLIQLGVAGVGILPETLAEIGQTGFLYQLDLSDVKIDNELLAVLESKALSKLAILKLNQSGLSDEQLLSLADSNRKLVFDAPRTEFGRSLYESLASDERVLLGRTFTDRLARSGAAAEALIESPYGRTAFEDARMNREIERRADRTRHFNP